ncbi:TetR/AcrR family transcriptional regulator [Priestia endophytica]|uniref:TetR/AcrR family transcriptional regulator n=1 Tax=Priestia endophytica TaxID=135735 RepID=UPI002E1AFF17|nr:TetR/AcrR family transcriptional regulator [Priestia endophytica]
MNEKKLKIIQEASMLFAEKGFHSTSVQEIAEKSGISKGAFYLYFQSKEELVTSLIDYYINQLEQSLESLESGDLSPKDKLISQIKFQYEFVHQNKQLIIGQFDQLMMFGEGMKDRIYSFKTRLFHWVESLLYEIYGESIHLLVYDIYYLLEGIQSSYYRLIFIEDFSIDSDRLSTFIFNRIDDIVQAMIEKNIEPLIEEDTLHQVFDRIRARKKERIFPLLSAIEHEIKALDASPKTKSHLLEIVNYLTEEAKNDEIKGVIFKGMLANFTDYDALRPYCEKLARELNIELLM